MIKSMTYYNKDVNINNKRQPSMIQLDYVTIKIAIIAKKKFLSVMQLPLHPAQITQDSILSFKYVNVHS